CFFLPRDEFDWSKDKTVSWIPSIVPSDDPDAWHPEDALFVPLRHADGHVLGVMSLDEPLSGKRASDDDLRVLKALADHAAQAVHLEALERLLAPEFEIEGCYLLDGHEACARLGLEKAAYETELNGRGPHA